MRWGARAPRPYLLIPTRLSLILHLQDSRLRFVEAVRHCRNKRQIGTSCTDRICRYQYPASVRLIPGCNRQGHGASDNTGPLAMFTKTLSALAIVLSTVSGAVAAIKHEGTAANRAPANKASPQNPRDKADFVIGNMLFVGFHEMGHVLADQFHLPTLGRAEDAADSFATIALLDAGSEFSVNVLVQAARGLFLSDRRDRKQGEEFDFSDAHGLDRQRAFQIVCLMVGSDKEQFKDLADWARMRQNRRRSCAADYESAKFAWRSLLESHQHSDGQPTAAIEVAYQAGHDNLE